MSGRRRHRVCVVLGAAAMLLYLSAAGGCLRKWRERQAARDEAARLAQADEAGSPAGVGPSPGESLPPETRASDGAAPGAFRGVTGLLEGGEPGLEVAVWTCDDTGFHASRALAAYAGRALPIEPSVLGRWRERGLRFVAVPIGEVDSLASSTRAMSHVQRQRLGQLTSWTPVVRGPRIPDGSPGAAGSLPGGKPRLIVRSWIEPDLSTGVVRRVMRVEAGVQIETGRPTRLLGDEEDLSRVSDDGRLLDGLVVSFVATGGDAIVLVGESPSVDWDALPGPSVGSDGDLGAVRARGPGGVGPGEPSGRSVGERMLSADAVPPRSGRPGTPPRKVLIVLIPRLIPPPGPEGVNDDTPGG